MSPPLPTLTGFIRKLEALTGPNVEVTLEYTSGVGRGGNDIKRTMIYVTDDASDLSVNQRVDIRIDAI